MVTIDNIRKRYDEAGVSYTEKDLAAAKARIDKLSSESGWTTNEPQSNWRESTSIIERIWWKVASLGWYWLKWMAEMGLWAGEFWWRAAEKVAGVTTSKLWWEFTELEKTAKTAKENIKEGREEFDKRAPQFIKDTTDTEAWFLEAGAEFAWEMYAATQAVWAAWEGMAAVKWSGLINSIGAKSPTYAKYLSAKAPDNVMKFTKFLGNVGLEGSIESALQNWEIKPSDLWIEAFSQIAFKWLGAASKNIANKLEPHINKTKVADFVWDYVGRVKKVVDSDDFKYTNNLTEKDAPFIHRLFPDAAPDDSLEVLDDLTEWLKKDGKRLEDVSEPIKLFRAIEDRWNEIGDEISRRYDILKAWKEGTDNFITNTRIKTSEVLEWRLQKENITNSTLGSVRPANPGNKAYTNEIRNQIQSMFDYKDSDLPGQLTFKWAIEWALDNSKNIQELRSNLAILDKEIDLADVFTYKKRLFPQVKGTVGGGRAWQSSKQSLVSLYETVKDKSFELVDKIPSSLDEWQWLLRLDNVNEQKAIEEIKNFKNLSRKYAKHKAVEGSVNKQIRKALNNSDKFKMSDRISVVYGAQKLADIVGWPASLGEWLMKWALPIWTNTFADRINSVDRADVKIMGKMMGEETKIDKLLKNIGQASESLSELQAAKTTTSIAGMKTKDALFWE